MIATRIFLSSKHSFPQIEKFIRFARRRESRDEPRKRATTNAFFRRRELLAFFISMAETRL